VPDAQAASQSTRSDHVVEGSGNTGVSGGRPGGRAATRRVVGKASALPGPSPVVKDRGNRTLVRPSCRYAAARRDKPLPLLRRVDSPEGSPALPWPDTNSPLNLGPAGRIGAGGQPSSSTPEPATSRPPSVDAPDPNAVRFERYRRLARRHIQGLPALFRTFTGLTQSIAWAPASPGGWSTQDLPLSSRLCRWFVDGKGQVLAPVSLVRRPPPRFDSQCGPCQSPV